ncbi:MAG: hypothetical protein AB7H66_04370 [Hyphomonadaceae bacterium]
MIGWVVAAVLGSIALTALLTLVLWRMNGALRQPAGKAPGAAGEGTSSGDDGVE